VSKYKKFLDLNKALVPFPLEARSAYLFWRQEGLPVLETTLTVCLVGGWVGWIGSNPVFGDGANPSSVWLHFWFWRRSQPILVFGWRIGDRAAPFSVWLKEFSVWWEPTRLERLRPPDFDGRVQPASERNILSWSQPNPSILQPNSHRNGFAPTRLAPLSNQKHGKIGQHHMYGTQWRWLVTFEFPLPWSTVQRFSDGSHEESETKTIPPSRVKDKHSPALSLSSSTSFGVTHSDPKIPFSVFWNT